MQAAISFLTVIGGLILSIAVALLAEELIFEQVIRVFFAKPIIAKAVVGQTVPLENGQKR